MKKNKSFLKKLTFTLISLSLLITVFTALAVSAETPIKTVGETVDIEKAFSEYTVQDTAAGSDEYVGDYQYTVYYDTKKGEVTSSYGGTPVVVYTVNHPSVKRIGTDSNEKIISSMLDRGYVVIVLDYLENEKASGSALEYSTQLFMRQFCFRKDNLVTDTKVLPSGYFREIFHAPSGYDVLLHQVFWEIDKHSVNGTFNKIVENWNSDFRAVKGENFLKWTRNDGTKKALQPDFDGNEPLWYDADQNPDPNGEYTYIKYTKAEVVTDCVDPDGSFIDMNLYINLVYPTSPDNEVPVMALANSSGAPSAITLSSDGALRPQSEYFLYNGYAWAVFDYLWEPMGRNASWGYYDGANGVSNDHMNYSLHIYNDKLVNTAAMRFLRYVSLEDESGKYNFDIDKFGVYGNSKGGWHNFLGESAVQSPLVSDSYSTLAELEDAISLALESFTPDRVYDGHHGETRYTAGATEMTIDGITLKAGEAQPWLTSGGKEIVSGAQITVPENGGSEEDITEGHMPIFVTSNMDDYLHAQYGVTMRIYNICRELDLPLLHLELPIGHALPTGNDINYNVDSYDIFKRFANYHLQNAPISVAYAVPMNDAGRVAVTEKITVAFVGQASLAEVEKISITSGGVSVGGAWESSFGGVVWTFTPDALEGGKEYKITVPAGFTGNNGIPTAEAYESSFITEFDEGCEPSAVSENSYTFTAPAFTSGNGFVFRFNVKNDAANVAELYTSDDVLLGTASLRGSGSYEIDITDYVAANAGKEITLTLKEKSAAGTVTVKDDALDGTELNSNITPNKNATLTTAVTIGDTAALRAEITGVYDYNYSKYYSNPTQILKYSKITGTDAITKGDVGRLYTFSIDVYDTASRAFQIRLKHMADQHTHETIDYDWTIKTFTTKANEWTTFTFTHRIYEPDYGIISSGTTQYLELLISPDGNTESSVYLKNLKVCEVLTDIEVSDAVIAEKVMPGGAYSAPVSSHPFAIYNGQTLVGEYDTLDAALAAYTSGYLIKLQSDYIFTDSDSGVKLSGFAEVNIDLGAYTVTCDNENNSLIWLKATSTKKTSVNITGGAILVGDTPIVSYGSAAAGGSGKQVEVSFTGVSIAFADLSGATSIVSDTKLTSGIVLSSKISFTDCDFELIDSKRAKDAAVLLAASDSAGLDISYKLSGGSIYMSSERWVSILENANSVSFGKNSDGSYTELLMPKSHSYSTGGSYFTENGYASYEADGENNNIVTYNFAISENSTVYGVIPDQYTDGTKYPFLLFKDGSFVSAHTSLSGVSSAAAALLKGAEHEGERAEILMRANHTGTNTGAIAHGTSAGTIVFDLGGHTLTRGGNAIAAPELTDSTPIQYKTSLVFKNGRVESKSGVMFVTHFRFSTTGIKEFDILFDNVTIGYAKGATTLHNALYNTWLNSHKASKIKTNVTFRNCTFDLLTNAPATVPTTTLMALGTNEAIYNVVIEGGVIKGDGTNVKFASKDSSDTLTLKPNSDGEYLRLTEGTIAPDISNFVFDDGKYRTFIKDAVSGDYILSEGGVSTPYGTITSEFASAETYPFAIFKYNSTSKTYEFKEAFTTWKSATAAINTYVTSTSDKAVLLVRRDYTNKSDSSNDTAINALKGTITFDLGGHTLTRSSTIFSFAVFKADYEANEGSVIIKNGALRTLKSQIFCAQIGGSIVANNKVFNVKVEDVTLGYAEGAVRGGNMFWATYTNKNSTADTVKLNVEFNNCTFDLITNDPGNNPLLFAFKDDSKNIMDHNVSINGGKILCNDLSAVTLYSVNSNNADKVTFGKNSDGEFTKLISATTAKDKSHYNKALPAIDGNRYFVEMADDGINSTYELVSLTTEYGSAPTTAKYLSAYDYPFYVFSGGEFIGAYENWKSAMSAALDIVKASTAVDLTANIVMRRDYDIYKATEGSVNFNTAYGKVLLDLGGYTLTTVDGYFIDISINNSTASYLGYASRFTVKNGTLLNKRSTLPSIGIGHSNSSSGARKQLVFEFIGVTFKTVNYSVFRDWGHSGKTGMKLDFTFDGCVFDFGITEKGTTMFYFKSGNSYVTTSVKFVGGSIVTDKAENYTLINYSSDDTVAFAKSSDGEYTKLTNPTKNVAPTFEFINDYGKTLCFTKESSKSNMTTYKLIPKSTTQINPKVSITLERDLIFNVYVPTNADILRIVLDGTEYSDLSKLEVREMDGKNFYVLNKELAAKYALESFTLEIYVDIGGSEAKGKWTIGVEKYATALLAADDTTDIEATLIKDILSYIGSAYTYFGSENAAEVNERIDALIGADYEDSNAPVVDGSADAPSLGLHSVTFVLDATPSLRFYLPDGADASLYKFYIDGKAVKTVSGTHDGRAYIELDTYAYAVCETVTYTIDGVESGSYHINSYYEWTKTQSNEALTSVVARFWRYCQSARAYRESAVSE